MTSRCFFFFNDTATTEIYTLSLHDALPISRLPSGTLSIDGTSTWTRGTNTYALAVSTDPLLHYNASCAVRPKLDRKSTRLNSSHLVISYAVFCLKKKNLTT